MDDARWTEEDNARAILWMDAYATRESNMRRAFANAPDTTVIAHAIASANLRTGTPSV